MAGAYDDRDGWIWMDGKLVDWRQANVHILTHAMHYASSVFEGVSAPITARSSKAAGIPSACWPRAGCWTSISPGPWTRSRRRKYEVMKANGLTDAYVRAVAWPRLG